MQLLRVVKQPGTHVVLIHACFCLQWCFITARVRSGSKGEESRFKLVSEEKSREGGLKEIKIVDTRHFKYSCGWSSSRSYMTSLAPKPTRHRVRLRVALNGERGQFKMRAAEHFFEADNEPL